ncbi:hypothetical protein Vadar_023203 [Vaccinium darrowii]|uniref:Uncharacterized protein n=1 Tax=Vaccinium darrowii TaxID=229202 RepID=A0ACB7Y8G0_9ERIC|nr:hypothetical protein Vadar_023203 [Vaccinium darrowii]
MDQIGMVTLQQPLPIATGAKPGSTCGQGRSVPLTASLPDKKMVRRTLKIKYRVVSVMFDHQQHFGRRFEGAAKSFRATRICRKHGINPVSRLKLIHKQHGIQQWPFRQKWATRKGFSLGDERPFEVSSLYMDNQMSKCARSSPRTLALPDGGEIVGPISSSSSEFVGTNDRPHLVRQDQSGSTASHYERKNTREIDLMLAYPCLRAPVGSTRAIGGHVELKTTNMKHLMLQPTKDILSRQIRVAPAYGGRHKNAGKGLANYLAWKPFEEHQESRFHKLNSLARKSFKVLDVLLLWEQSNNIRHFVLRRRLELKRWVRLKKSQDLPRTLQMNCSGSLTAQSASSLHWPISLPDGGRDHEQHFSSRCDYAANSLGAKPICEQHGFNLVSTVKCIGRQYGIHRSTFRQGFSFGGERPAGVLSPSMEEKVVSRLQFLYISWLARSSRHPLALRSGSEILGHIAFSSSELAANNGAHPGRQDKCGSSASRPNKERGKQKMGKGHIPVQLVTRNSKNILAEAVKMLCRSLALGCPPLGASIDIMGFTGGHIREARVSKKNPDQLEGQTTQSTAHPNANALVETHPNANALVSPLPQPSSTHMSSENEDWRYLLASREEALWKGHVYESSDFVELIMVPNVLVAA